MGGVVKDLWMGGDENASMNREEIQKIYSQAVQRVLERIEQEQSRGEFKDI